MNATPISNVTLAYLKKSHETTPIDVSLKNDAATDNQVSFNGLCTGFFGKLFGGIIRFFSRLFGKTPKVPVNAEAESLVKTDTLLDTKGSINPIPSGAEENLFAASIQTETPPQLSTSTGKPFITNKVSENDLIKAETETEVSVSTDSLSGETVIQHLQDEKNGTFAKFEESGFQKLEKSLNTSDPEAKSVSEIITKQLGLPTMNSLGEEEHSFLGFDPTTVKDFLKGFPNLKKVTMVLGNNFQELYLPTDPNLRKAAVESLEANKRNIGFLSDDDEGIDSFNRINFDNAKKLIEISKIKGLGLEETAIA
jgi:hypothetical protein